MHETALNSHGSVGAILTIGARLSVTNASVMLNLNGNLWQTSLIGLPAHDFLSTHLRDSLSDYGATFASQVAPLLVRSVHVLRNKSTFGVVKGS